MKMSFAMLPSAVFTVAADENYIPLALYTTSFMLQTILSRSVNSQFHIL